MQRRYSQAMLFLAEASLVTEDNQALAAEIHLRYCDQRPSSSFGRSPGYDIRKGMKKETKWPKTWKEVQLIRDALERIVPQRITELLHHSSSSASFAGSLTSSHDIQVSGIGRFMLSPD